MKTTKQIAARLVVLCKKKKFSEARKELFAEDAVCQEADNKIIKGLTSLEEKHRAWQESLEKIHGLRISKPLMNGDFFSMAFSWDVTYKGKERGGWKEIGVFQVKDGKVILEKYFY